MNLNLIRPKNKTQDLLPSVTKNCETFVHEIQTRPKETLEFKMIKPRRTFYFNRPFQVEYDWMSGLIRLEVYNPIFKITEKKFEVYKFPDVKGGGFSK